MDAIPQILPLGIIFLDQGQIANFIDLQISVIQPIYADSGT
jgi:hypothetical protein